jgi:hypothetical protein
MIISLMRLRPIGYFAKTTENAAYDSHCALKPHNATKVFFCSDHLAGFLKCVYLVFPFMWQASPEVYYYCQS